MISFGIVFIGVLTVSAALSIYKINSIYQVMVNDMNDDLKKFKLYVIDKMSSINEDVLHNKRALHMLSKPKPKGSTFKRPIRPISQKPKETILK